MYNLQPKVCFFFKKSHNKKKRSKKGRWKLWKLPTFPTLKTHKDPQKSTQRHPGEDHAPGRDHIARTLGRSTAPSGTRGGDWAETDRVQNSKRRKFRSLEKNIFLDDFCFGVFEDVCFSMFFPSLVVFGYGCIWVVFVSTVGGLIMFCALLQPYAPDVTSFIACHLATFVAWLKTCSYQRSFWMKENRGE